VPYLKQITNDVKQSIRNENKPLYVRLINAYVNKVEELQLTNEYSEMLWDTFLKEERFEYGSDEWMTYVRLRMIAFLLIVHLHMPQRYE
jgi:hypothetical protein